MPFDPALRGVILSGIAVLRCPECGHFEVEIPHLDDLHRAIAAHLVEHPRRILGPEVRYLRKWLGWSGQDFARRIGVSPETVSRWENERGPIGGTSDRLLRLMVLFERPDPGYSLDRVAEIADVPDTAPPAPARFSPTDNG